MDSVTDLGPGEFWQRALVRQIDAGSHDTVVDVGCGTGEVAVMVKMENPAARVYGLDPRASSLDLAERRAITFGATVHFVHATLGDAEAKLAARSPTQIVCSRVLGHLPFFHRSAFLASMFKALPRGGILHIADAGWRRHLARFRSFSRSLETDAHDAVLTLFRTAGFADCSACTPVFAGESTIHIFRGVKL